MSGVGNKRHAGVADERNLRALFERDEQLGSARHLVVLVITDERFADFIMVEQLLRMASVFAGDLIDFFEYAQGAQGDVFEVANGRADQVQTAQRVFRVDRRGTAHAEESSTRCRAARRA